MRIKDKDKVFSNWMLRTFLAELYKCQPREFKELTRLHYVEDPKPLIRLVAEVDYCEVKDLSTRECLKRCVRPMAKRVMGNIFGRLNDHRAIFFKRLSLSKDSAVYACREECVDISARLMLEYGEDSNLKVYIDLAFVLYH